MMFSKTPVYLQIRENLYNKIISGDYRSGDKIPSEDDLAALYGVSRVTVNKALAELVHLGYLQRRQGAGTFVGKLRKEGTKTDDLSFYVSMRRRGFSVETKVLTQDVVPPPRRVSECLQIPVTREVLRLRRLREVNRRPVVLQDSYLTGDCIDGLKGVDFSACSLYEALKTRCGYEMTRARDVVEAMNADEQTARFLEMPVQSAVLSIRRRGYARHDVLVEFTQSVYRNDQYEVEIEYRQESDVS